MNCPVDLHHGNLVPVFHVQIGVVENRQLINSNGDLGSQGCNDRVHDLPGVVAQMATRFSNEGESHFSHASSLGESTRTLDGMPEVVPPPPSDRPIVAFFDVDNTLMRGASVYYVGREAHRRGLISWRDIALFAWHQFRFLAVGENRNHLSTARERALGLASGHTEVALRGLAEDIYERDIAPNLWPETVALTREHLDKGHEVWLITATPQLVAQIIADRLGLTGALGTKVEALDGVFTGALDGHVLHGDEKALVAERLSIEKGADLEDCWGYSDSGNDIPLLTLVGNPVVVNPDAKLLAHAKKSGWNVLPLKRSSIRDARRQVKREARAVK